ncbi:hypothetical protein AXG89_26835 (plasmid) [Burkholderia sp. PAMC 26561]|nr:hypothetical protein AXG89_25855 [Burkholderia sp. PAMC 26561]AME27534.2 hypothetical protein AXG89_26835 [Burkholderia sp. PAMC 26561]
MIRRPRIRQPLGDPGATEDEQSAFLTISSDAELDPAGFNVSFTDKMPGDATVVTGGRSVIV